MADDIDAHLGRRLRRRRRLLGLTQTELAAAVGVRFQQIQKYECGANRISAARLWMIAQTLQAPIAYFYEGACEATPPPTLPKILVTPGGRTPGGRTPEPGSSASPP